MHIPTAFLLLPVLASLSLAAQRPLSTAAPARVPKIAAASWTYSDCGSSSDAILLESLEVSPDPPAPGKNLTITAKGRAAQRIEDGAYADVIVKMGLIKLLTKKFDVCKEAENAQASIQCPVDEGAYEVVHTVALPREIPPAKFNVQVRGYTADDENMLCLDLIADFRRLS